MTSDASLERLLVTVMADEASLGDGEDAIDRILTTTRELRPRPRWLALLKESPMRTSASVQAGSPALRRTFLLLALVAIALIGVLAVSAGSSLLRPSEPPLPAPFGLAQNGKLVFAQDGSLFAATADGSDPVALIRTPGSASDPSFSRDGTRVAFRHQGSGINPPAWLWIADADGSSIAEWAPWPDRFDWSPDGRFIASLRDPGSGEPTISIVATQGKRDVRTLDLGGLSPFGWVAWRPPDGREILFTAHPRVGSNEVGVYAVSPDGGPFRIVAPPTTGAQDGDPAYADPELSPDGRTLAFWTWGPDEQGVVNGWGHVRDLDSGEERISHAYGGKAQRFTPDGKFVIGEGDHQLVVEPIDGGPARPIGPKWTDNQPFDFVVSPDGTKVYLTIGSPGVTWLIDFVTGQPTTMQDGIVGLPSPQRVPPGSTP
jgi:dipeptidyl aminopeptidase/acylaminoacyl peptidase